MKKEVIFVLLNEYADWEPAFLSAALYSGMEPGCPVPYTTKTMSVTKEPVKSLGGFTTLPDYDLFTIPDDYAALILVGGMQWQSEEAEMLVAVVREAFEKNKVVGGICNASLFLGKHGFLNDVKHTSNTLDVLKEWGGETYTGEKLYVHQQAASDRNVVTANGTGYLEFTREVLLLLQGADAAYIERNYAFNKVGLCELLKGE